MTSHDDDYVHGSRSARMGPGGSSAVFASAADAVEGAIRRLVPDLQARAAVEEALREMVMDVEIAHTLQDQASKHLVIARLREEIAQHKLMLDERTMLDVERRQEEGRLADQLVRELWVLSEEMGHLQKIKAQHKELLMQHDEVVAQLLQAQEELADAQERAVAGNAPASAATVAAATAAADPSQAPAVDRSSSSPAVVQATAPPPIIRETPEGKEKATVLPQLQPISEEAPQAEPKPATPPENEVLQPPEPIKSEGTITAPPPVDLVEEKEAAVVPAASPTAPVVALEEEHEPDAPKLEEFEESILMLIFSYLDALDILNTAQVNISMYSRVDTLFFGNGNDPNSDDSTIGTNEATTSSATDRSVPTTAASSSTAASVATTSHPPSTPKASSSSSSAAAAAATKSPPPPPTPSSTAAPSAQSPTVVRLPPTASPAKPAQAATATTTTTTTGPPALSPPPPSTASAPASTASSPSRAAASGLSLFSSILQPRLPGASTAAAATANAKPGTVPMGTIVGTSATASSSSGSSTTSGLLVPHRRSASVDAAAPSQPQPMNAAMANSMASKLSDAELNAIIVMTERLKSREQVAEKLRRENDELRAKLDGADALKEYLIGKVRDMEKSVSSTEEQDAKTALQIASDQEVIAFLDARVQELEAEGRARSKELEESIRQRAQLKSDADQKVKVLSDMLQFERERVKENEVEWKATRKVLVKEVKNLRAQMAALVAERDGYREQNEQLRRAVVTSFSNSASPSRLRQGSFS